MDAKQIVIPVAILVLFVASMLLTEFVGRGWTKGFGVVCLIAAFGMFVVELILLAS